MVQFKNILVIQTAFIGDTILASSLVEKLHAFFPEAAITILVRNGNELIYEHHPFLKEVLIWDKSKKKTRNLFNLLFKVRRNKYDCVVNCHRYASSGLVAGFSGARHIAGYKQNPFSFLFNYTVKHVIGDGRHETERYNQLVEDFTDNKIFKPKLHPSQKDIELVKTYQAGPYVCMAPASVWFTKQLPVEKWIDLCNKTDPANSIYLIGGKDDAELCGVIKSKSVHINIQNLAGKLTPLQSCRLMQFAKMNYVNDSAPLHLASSANAPLTAFFLSTVPEFGFGPLSENATTVGVIELECRPCGIHGYRACPLGHFKCGHLININSVRL